MLVSYDVETRELTIIPDKRTFDIDSLMDFRASYQKYIGSDIDRICIDFRQVSTLNSTGVGMLLHMRKLFRDGTSIDLVNLSPPIKQVMSICGMHRKFKFS